MASVNKVILLGNLGKDPEVKYLEGDNVVANIPLATTESYKDRNGNKVDQTEWHHLELWGNQAKIAEQWLKKGMQIYVEGKIKSDQWQDDQGKNRKNTKIRVLDFTMLGGGKDREGDGNAHSSTGMNSGSTNQPHSSTNQPSQSYERDPAAVDDDDLPF